MTTIAYKDGIIAYDSRAMRGDCILTDNIDKKRETEERKTLGKNNKFCQWR